MKSIVTKFHENDECSAREVARARLRVEVSECLLILMEDAGISKAELAKKLKVTPSAITQSLSGDRNMTLNMIADIALALEHEPCFHVKHLHEAEEDRTRPAPEYFTSRHYLHTLSGANAPSNLVTLPVSGNSALSRPTAPHQFAIAAQAL